MKKNIEDFLNKVYPGDVFDLLKQLPDGSIDCVYGDPDYNVGRKYGDKNYTRQFSKYIEWYTSLAKECFRVLKDTGNLFLINYPKQNSYLRVNYLDNAFYEVYDYAWIYNSNIGHSSKHFTTAHRSILHGRKTKNSKFYKNNVAEPYKNPTDKRILQNIANGSKGRMPYSWLYYDLVKNVSREKTFHSCQIPTGLSETLFKASTQPGDIVLVLFGGSGSEIMVCKKLNRYFVSAEIDEKYYEMIIARLAYGGEIPSKFKLQFKEKHRYKD